jgi:hypothetical protein
MTTTQRDDAWLQSATPEAIDAAHEAGELADILGTSRFPSKGQLTPEHLGKMTQAEIAEAYAAGRLDNVTGKQR